MKGFQKESFLPRITRITALGGEMMYVIEGSEKAAVIDTCSGFGRVGNIVYNKDRI